MNGPFWCCLFVKVGLRGRLPQPAKSCVEHNYDKKMAKFQIWTHMALLSLPVDNDPKTLLNPFLSYPIGYRSLPSCLALVCPSVTSSLKYSNGFLAIAFSFFRTNYGQNYVDHPIYAMNSQTPHLLLYLSTGLSLKPKNWSFLLRFFIFSLDLSLFQF